MPIGYRCSLLRIALEARILPSAYPLASKRLSGRTLMIYKYLNTKESCGLIYVAQFSVLPVYLVQAKVILMSSSVKRRALIASSRSTEHLNMDSSSTPLYLIMSISKDLGWCTLRLTASSSMGFMMSKRLELLKSMFSLQVCQIGILLVQKKFFFLIMLN